MIGEARCLKEFKINLKSKYSIRYYLKGPRLMVEVEDIMDELSALNLVLTDQKATIRPMNEINRAA